MPETTFYIPTTTTSEIPGITQTITVTGDRQIRVVRTTSTSTFTSTTVVTTIVQLTCDPINLRRRRKRELAKERGRGWGAALVEVEDLQVEDETDEEEDGAGTGTSDIMESRNNDGGGSAGSSCNGRTNGGGSGSCPPQATHTCAVMCTYWASCAAGTVLKTRTRRYSKTKWRTKVVTARTRITRTHFVLETGLVQTSLQTPGVTQAILLPLSGAPEATITLLPDIVTSYTLLDPTTVFETKTKRGYAFTSLVIITKTAPKTITQSIEEVYCGHNRGGGDPFKHPDNPALNPHPSRATSTSSITRKTFTRRTKTKSTRTQTETETTSSMSETESSTTSETTTSETTETVTRTTRTRTTSTTSKSRTRTTSVGWNGLLGGV